MESFAESWNSWEKTGERTTRISAWSTGHFGSDGVLGKGICLEGSHIPPWLPQSSLYFGLCGFDSPLSYQSLPCPFPLTQAVALSLHPLPQLSWSLPPSEGRSSGCPCCSGTSETAPGKSLLRPDFRGAIPAPSVHADSPGALSKDSWIGHLHIHLSRVAGVFWVHLYLNPPAEGNFLACLISQWLFFSLKSSGRGGFGSSPLHLGAEPKEGCRS